jgi:hypothetical protein
MSLFPDVIQFSALDFASSLRSDLEDRLTAKAQLYNYDFHEERPCKSCSGRYDWLLTEDCGRESLGSKSTASVYRDELVLTGTNCGTEDDWEDGEEAEVAALPVFALKHQS